ncbi:MAG: hypothetical protein A2091_05055 [Desulfuromonadales bacterium GWD2_61_12]|nr:MAG: hypothetical protein A2005_07685 [Desulfuromonadales bacterium GWC2_61_20]OGR34859.1 MAG: hypothetical protein A2091_05055 [Desulfuromonadales bacterium GWD2_61_12]
MREAYCASHLVSQLFHLLEAIDKVAITQDPCIETFAFDKRPFTLAPFQSSAYKFITPTFLNAVSDKLSIQRPCSAKLSTKAFKNSFCFLADKGPVPQQNCMPAPGVLIQFLKAFDHAGSQRI